MRNPLREGVDNGGSRYQMWCGDLKDPAADVDQSWISTNILILDLLDSWAAVASVEGGRSGELPGSVGQGAAVAPDFLH